MEWIEYRRDIKKLMKGSSKEEQIRSEAEANERRTRGEGTFKGIWRNLEEEEKVRLTINDWRLTIEKWEEGRGLMEVIRNGGI